MTPPHRVAYEVAGRALRQAMNRAIEARLTLAEHRVLLAVLALTGTYSKLADETYVSVIADIAEVSERHCRRVMDRLADLGIIGWDPRRGQSVRSRVWLPQEGESGHRGSPVFEREPLSKPTENRMGEGAKPDRLDAKTGHADVRRPRSTEKYREEPVRRSRVVGAAYADTCYLCDPTGQTRTEHGNGGCLQCASRPTPDTRSPS